MTRVSSSSGRLKRVTRTSVAESAYEAFRDSILQGRYPPGEQLVEARLASELGVSRGPVCEALGRLTEDGMLVDIHHRGTFVRELAPADVIDIYNVRIGLESVAVQLMIGAGRSVRPLGSLVDDMRKAARANGPARLSRAEFRFHETLCELSGNSLLASVYRSISSQVQMVLSLKNASYLDPQEIADEHVPLIDAVEAGDAKVAAERITQHVVCPLEPLFARLPGHADIPQAKRLIESVK
jgi:DNA-binding GntR family transcriptional regulator